MNQYKVGILGATGLVGRTVIAVMEERKFPVSSIVLIASERSRGKKITFLGETFEVQIPTEYIWKDIDIAIFSAGAEKSKFYGPKAVSSGCVVIDNSSAFRMDPHVPLVVPEVNGHSIFDSKGKPYSIIANPNCSTIQMVVALKPLHDAYTMKEIVVSTYQSVTGKGKEGLEALEREVQGETFPSHTHYKPIAFNVVPQVDVFLDNGYTKEEMKMVHETHKIFNDSSIQISPTTVRVPVYGGHSESIRVTFEKEPNVADVMEMLSKAPGVRVEDDPKTGTYPTPLECYGQDDVFVGRIRSDIYDKKSLNLWVVSDNLRKGAATNAIQIAEYITKHSMLTRNKVWNMKLSSA